MQIPNTVRNRMRLLATQRGHLQIDFSKIRLMDEPCPIANLVLDGKNFSAHENSRVAELTNRFPSTFDQSGKKNLQVESPAFASRTPLSNRSFHPPLESFPTHRTMHWLSHAAFSRIENPRQSSKFSWRKTNLSPVMETLENAGDVGAEQKVLAHCKPINTP